MKLSLSPEKLGQYVKRQVDTFFPDENSTEIILEYIDVTLIRVEACFDHINTSYYKKMDKTYFNHLHSSQYAAFLYLLSNTLHNNDVDSSVCEKLFFLNKALNGVDVLYSVKLPTIFLLGHPVGSVIGKAGFSDYLVIYQNCTIGGNYNRGSQIPEYPRIGKYFEMYKGASVIGNCHIGDNCKVSAHSILYNTDLDDNSLYIGTPENYIIKENTKKHKVWTA